MTLAAAQVGRYDEALCYFERLQQNLLFLAMLADQQVGWLHALKAALMKRMQMPRDKLDAPFKIFLKWFSMGLPYVLGICCVRVQDNGSTSVCFFFPLPSIPYCIMRMHFGLCTAWRSHRGVFGVTASGIFD